MTSINNNVDGLSEHNQHHQTVNYLDNGRNGISTGVAFIYCVVKGSKNVIIIGLILCYQYGKKLINMDKYALRMACDFVHEIIVKYLVEQAEVQGNEGDLTVTCFNGYEAVIKCLVEHGVDAQGNTLVLATASEKGNETFMFKEINILLFGDVIEVLYQNYRKIKALNDNIESNGKKLLEVKIYKFIPTLSQYLNSYSGLGFELTIRKKLWSSPLETLILQSSSLHLYNPQNSNPCRVLAQGIISTITEGKLIVDKGILLGVISDKNQTILLNAISNYGNEFYLKFIWDVQRMVHVYNLSHVITISIADCMVNDKLRESYLPIMDSILNKMDPIPVLNLDSLIENQNKFENYNECKNQVFRKYCDLTELVESIDNNLTNIIDSGSIGNVNNVIQILMSIGVQAILPVCYIKSSYSEGLTTKELFIHSKSGRAGIISSSLNTSSIGMEDLVTDEQDVVHNYTNEEIYYYSFSTNKPDIDEIFLEHAFSMASL
ncbi:hypothetical protein H8356DRAFT_1333230 [Neocallimastix lanati (nom. inval.)]|nr:hypothetical protein H8356DRAFT_1333230 [Neocallimastix sp. JGI-2020a]